MCTAPAVHTALDACQSRRPSATQHGQLLCTFCVLRQRYCLALSQHSCCWGQAVFSSCSQACCDHVAPGLKLWHATRRCWQHCSLVRCRFVKPERYMARPPCIVPNAAQECSGVVGAFGGPAYQPVCQPLGRSLLCFRADMHGIFYHAMPHRRQNQSFVAQPVQLPGHAMSW